MYKVCWFFFFALILQLYMPAPCYGQAADTTVVEEVIADDKPNYFNAVTEEAAAPVAARAVPPTAVDSLKKDEAFWYSDYEPAVKKRVEQKPSRLLQLLASGWFRILLWTIVIGGFIAILIWFLKASDVRLYRKKESSKPVATEGIQENIFAIDYEAEIEAAIAAGNYRQAVRLLYLQTLRHLSENGNINYRQERTNSMYRQELFGTPLYQPFSRLTRHFEFVWYGQFPLSAQAFERIREDYLQLRKEVVA